MTDRCRVPKNANDWVILADALAYIDKNDDSGLGFDAERLLFLHASSGFRVFGRRAADHERELIPQRDWQRHCKVDSTFDGRRLHGIHFDPRATSPWCDLAMRRADLEAQWPPRPRLYVRVYDEAELGVLQKGRKSRPKVNDRAWHYAQVILNSEQERPPKGRGRVRNVAKAVREKIFEEGDEYKLNTIEGAIRKGLRDWEHKNPQK